MLRLRAGTSTLLIGPRSSAGEHGGRYCLDSEADIRQRLTQSLQDPASCEAIRRFWGHWQSDHRLAGVKDQSIVDRIAHLGVRGPLIVFLMPDTSVQRRDDAGSRATQAAEVLRKQFMPWSGRVKPPPPVSVAPVDRSVIKWPERPVGDWSIAKKLASIVTRTADSRKLSLDVQQQLKGLLADKYFMAWLVGSLLVWFAAQFFVIGEIVDALMIAAMALRAGGIFFALRSSYDAGHLIGEFVEATRTAKDEKDLNTAADILANIIVMIGVTALIAALTHATTRATSEGKPASTVKKPPSERAPKVERTTERPTTPPAKEPLYVLGRQIDTAVAKNWEGHSILDIPDWTLAKNDAFIQGIIDKRGTVYLGSPQNAATLWDPVYNRPTVFARELAQLKAAGYTQSGDYMYPPAK